MFDAYCSACDAVVLLSPRRIMALQNTPEGIVLRFRCYCGTDGVATADEDPRGRADVLGPVAM